MVKGWVSFDSFERNLLINGNPKVAYLSTHNSVSETFIHLYTWLAVIVKGWVSFHSCEGNPLIIGNYKVAYFSTNYSESQSFHTIIVGQQSSFKDGYILALTFQKVNLFTLV